MALYKKNIVFQYGLELARYFFPFVTIPFLTRVLGPDVYAVRAYILAAMTFVQVFLLFGFNSYGTKEVATRDSDTFLRELTSSIMLVRVGLCIIAAVAVALLIFFIPIMASNSIYVWLAFVGVCFKCCLPDFVFQGKEDMGIITNRFVVSQIISTLLIVGFVRSPSDLLLVPIFEGIAALIAFGWSWYNAYAKYNIYFVRVSLRNVITTFKSSGIFFLSNASTTIFSSLTTLMIGFFIADPAEISYWAIAMTAITAVQALYTPVTNSIYPHICRTKEARLIRKMLLLGVPIVLFGTGIYAYLSDLIMLVLGGEAYIDGSYVIVLTSPVLFFSFIAMMLGFPVLAAFGKVSKLTLSSTISAGFHIVGLVLLAAVGAFSILNVAVLRCLTEFILAFLRFIFAYRVLSAKAAS